MFNKVLKPSNPFTELEGIYKVPYKSNTTVSEIKKELAKLDLDFYKKKTATKLVLAGKIASLYEIHTMNKPSIRLSRVLKSLEFSDTDITKICSLEPSDKAEFEYWELTTKHKDFMSMGTSRHWTSCYAQGYYKNTKDSIARYPTVALLRTFDKTGGLKARFVIFQYGTGYYPGETESVVSNDPRIYTGNTKRHTRVKSVAIAKLFNDGKAIKLEGAELKEFSWIPKTPVAKIEEVKAEATAEERVE